MNKFFFLSPLAYSQLQIIILVPTTTTSLIQVLKYKSIMRLEFSMTYRISRSQPISTTHRIWHRRRDWCHWLPQWICVKGDLYYLLVKEGAAVTFDKVSIKLDLVDGTSCCRGRTVDAEGTCMFRGALWGGDANDVGEFADGEEGVKLGDDKGH